MSKKKILAIILSVLLVCMSFASCGGKKDDSKNNELNSSPADVSVQNVDDQGIKTDYGNASNVKIDANQGSTELVDENTVCEEAKIFAGGKFYTNCVIFSGDNDGMECTMACDGKNIQADITVEGLTLSLLAMDGTAYLLDISNKNYMEVSKTLLSTLGMDDLDLSLFTNIAQEGIGQSLETANQYDVNINNEPGKCIELPDNEGNITKFYCIGDKLIQIEMYDSSNALQMQMTFNSITRDIPSDTLTIKGYNKCGSIVSFVTGLAKGMME